MMSSHHDAGEEDVPQLPSDTLAILQDFYSENQAAEEQLDGLRVRIAKNEPLSMSIFKEDWNASQFWYSDETAIILAKQLLEDVTNETRIAVVSAPSVFLQLKNLLASGAYASPHIRLLEYDQRFNVFDEEFVHYTYETPTRLPAEMKGFYNRILCDPPFLSSDCQTKAATTVRWLLDSDGSRANSASVCKIIVCTGEQMQDLILKLYPGIRATTFEPRHEQDRLSNAFRCYATFDCATWTCHGPADDENS